MTYIAHTYYRVILHLANPDEHVPMEFYGDTPEAAAARCNKMINGLRDTTWGARIQNFDIDTHPRRDPPPR